MMKNEKIQLKQAKYFKFLADESQEPISPQLVPGLTKPQNSNIYSKIFIPENEQNLQSNHFRSTIFNITASKIEKGLNSEHSHG